MLYIEDNLKYGQTLDLTYMFSESFSFEDIAYTCDKLEEAGFIEIQHNIAGSLTVLGLTYDGHVFLDNIRDASVWKKTKAKISKFTSVSLPIIQNIAAQIIVDSLK